VDEESELPENIYQLFVEYLQVEDIDFETSADRHLKELKKSEAYFSETDKARELIRELEQLVNEQKKLSLMENREQLENALKLEWISVTRGGAEKIQESLPLDLVITESLSILSNPERYKEVLSN
jgi:hypothetical protein